MMGMWTHKDLLAGTFTFSDLMDVHELLDLKEENQQRGRAWAEQNAKR